MASVINVGALTINAEEARLVSEIIAPLIYQNPDFLRYHNLVTGIDKKTQIVLDNGGGMAGWLDAGGTPPESGGMDTVFSELFWELVTIGDQKVHTQADLNQNFKMTVKKFAADHKNLEGSPELQAYIIAKIERYIKESVERLIWLADTAADSNANGGYLKPAVNKKYYNPIKGIWQQAFTYVGAGTTPRFTITANAQATKALQNSVLTDALAYAAIKGVYDNADDLLKSDKTAYIKATPKVYHGYISYLQSSSLSGGGMTSMLVDGIQQPAYNGIPIYLDLFIGNRIISDMEVLTGSPSVATYNLPHRVVMTTPANVPVATLSDTDINTVESFYYQKDRNNYMRFAYDLDVKVLRPELISVGY